MGRRQKGDKVSGWLVVDKPLGVTSTQVVGRVRRLFDAQKAGHGGTLDPLASGILPIAFGEATKTVAYAMDGDKSYRFVLRWGQATATDDAEGDVIGVSDRRPTRKEIDAVLPAFVGQIEQVPPLYSAVKVAGNRAYDLARAAEVFELAPRLVRIDEFELISMKSPDFAAFRVKCGKGTYMRSLARDLGVALGTKAHIVELRRLRVGPFDEKCAISLESLEALGHSPAAFEQLLPIETALDGIPALALSEAEARRLRSGQAISLVSRVDRARVEEFRNGATVFAKSAGKPVALARYEGGEIRPVRVINL